MNITLSLDTATDLRVHIDFVNPAPNSAPLQGYWFEIRRDQFFQFGDSLDIHLPGRKQEEITAVRIEYLQNGITENIDLAMLPNIVLKSRDFWARQLRNEALKAVPSSLSNDGDDDANPVDTFTFDPNGGV
jgi:hypothetical protein